MTAPLAITAVPSLVSWGGWENVLAVPRQRVSNSAIQDKFAELVRTWRNETAHLSSVKARVANPAYQAIIALGPDVVPFLLGELGQRPTDWFEALRQLTHADPVPPEKRGKVQEMADEWLRWGRAKQLIV